MSDEKKKPIDEKKKPIDAKKMLQPHQDAFIKHFIKSKFRGAIAIHGVGTGKTLTAAVAAELYLKKNPDNRVVVITPKSLMDNFKKELYEYEPEAKDNKAYEFYTYDEFAIKFGKGKTKKCDDALLIIDEAHNMRTDIKGTPKIRTEVTERKGFEKKYVVEKAMDVKSGGKAYGVLKGCGVDADKILMLTATPLVNDSDDIDNLMSVINGIDPSTKLNHKILWSMPEKLKQFYGCKLSFFDHNEENKDKFFPAVEQRFMSLLMKGDILEDYQFAQYGSKNPVPLAATKRDPFGTKMRRFANSVGGVRNPKLVFIGHTVKAIVEGKENKKLGLTQKMIDTHTDKVVIFSHFIEEGVDLIANKLDRLNVDYEIIDGSVSRDERDDIVKRYNENKNKVLIISMAGAEGLNLKETGYMFIMDQGWNMTESVQMKGRGVRFMSHAALPKMKRNVFIADVFLIKPHEKTVFKKLIEGDDFGHLPDRILSSDLKLWRLSHHKEDKLREVISELKSFKQLEECDDDEAEVFDVDGLVDKWKLVTDEKSRPTTWQKEFYETKHDNSANDIAKMSEMHLRGDEDTMTVAQLKRYTTELKRAASNSGINIISTKLASKMITFSGIHRTKYPMLFLDPYSVYGMIPAVAINARPNKLFSNVVSVNKSSREFISDFPNTVVLAGNNIFKMRLRKYRVILLSPPKAVAANVGLTRTTYDTDYVLRSWRLLASPGILVAFISDNYNTPRGSFSGVQDESYDKFNRILDDNEHEILEYESGLGKRKSRKHMIKIYKK